MINALPLDCHSLSQSDAEVISLNPTAKEIQHQFECVEKTLPFREDKSLGKWLTFSKNKDCPIHRWYHYKEGYSHELVTEVLRRYPQPSNYPAVLDPFCGAGTTLLVAQNNGFPSMGIEINPFAAFLSEVKTQWDKIDPDKLEKALKKVLNNSQSTPSKLPELTTLHKKQYFPNNHSYELIRLRDAIRNCEAEPLIQKILLLALLSTLDDVSYLRKDGRLLRYHPHPIIHPKEALVKRVSVILEDLTQLPLFNLQNPSISVIEGDARQITKLISNFTKFGLILYSPPYPNKFDYGEIYKCELWIAGFITSYKQWKQLRLKTFRSHPGCKFPQTSCVREILELREVYPLIELAARCRDISKTSNSIRQQAPEIMRGYFDDIVMTLQQQIAVLADGGHIVCVVGNSKHGNLHIPADTLIAMIGKALGLELIDIIVAKYRNSRNQQQQKLRESLVIFRKKY